MAYERKKVQNKQYVESPVNNSEYFGVNSCASCRYVDYNGEICMNPVSPFAGQKITEDDWCRYWAPKLHNPSFRF